MSQKDIFAASFRDGGFLAHPGILESIRIKPRLPATGDSFTVTSNTVAPGDGRTIEALSDLRQRNTQTGEGGYGTGFASLQQRVGAQVSAAENRSDIALAERESAERAVSDLSGVNLDEEAANLMQHQQAYQANAQVMSVARELFDTLLQAI